MDLVLTSIVLGKKAIDDLKDESNKQKTSLKEAEKELADLAELVKELEDMDIDVDVNTVINDQQLAESLSFNPPNLERLSSEPIGGMTWDEYFERVNLYIDEKQLNLSENPMNSLLTQQHQLDIINQVKQDYKMKAAH